RHRPAGDCPATAGFCELTDRPRPPLCGSRAVTSRTGAAQGIPSCQGGRRGFKSLLPLEDREVKTSVSYHRLRTGGHVLSHEPSYFVPYGNGLRRPTSWRRESLGRGDHEPDGRVACRHRCGFEALEGEGDT